MSAGKLRFCRDDTGGNTICREAFREDRRMGLMYGSAHLPDGRILWSPYAFAEAHLCSYCGAYVPTNAERRQAEVARAIVDHPAGADADVG